jgi:hypothetical protein
MQVCLITALIVKRYKRKNYSFVIILLNIRLIEKTKPCDINACCEESIENPQRVWTCFSLVVYLLTGWICWFVFLPFILFDYRETLQGKHFQKIQSVLL